MSARALQAGSIAFQTFANELAAEKVGNDFQKFGASTDNYDVVFRESEETFSFTFRLRPYRGGPVMDGVLTYEISKADLKVTKTRFR